MLSNSENAGAIAHCDQSNAYTGPFVGYAPLPAGDYTLEAVESDYAANAMGTGMLLKFKCQVVGGEHDGQPYYINLSLEHDNPEAQDIGQRDFAAMRHAIGVLNPDDTEQLHCRPFRVTIGQKLHESTGVLENFIKAYLRADSGEERCHAA
ncbi:DUF669 domain-containing protein [Bosea sp. (in: a-proteobacteria)]|uniref:DUF669 domain-containing protein n=1 Tax=Bosea sp. (in: a-proteobacteria) TaxID=1871050 RepID=UPI002B487E63|nr:DUF669 domain-containing protein [Bosea sp. (in: a-proteobacteria)]WRH59162.1 MAG: DUF669 domain-containing protein [Bosea sp. (in: a-proteobacteria)]